MKNYLFWRILILVLLIIVLVLWVIWGYFGIHLQLFRNFFDFSIHVLSIVLPITIFITYLISIHYTKPIKNLITHIEKICEGEFIDQQYLKRKDEIGQFTNKFEKTLRKLKRNLTEFVSERHKFSILLDNINEGILIVDNTGRVLTINRSAKEMFNINEDHAIGHTLTEIIRHHRVNNLWEKCKDSRKQQFANIETSVNRNYLQCSATPLEPLTQGLMLLQFQDITRIRKLEVIRQDFVSNVSHELRTPLTSMKAITETLLDGALNDPPMAQKFLEQIRNEIDNLTQLVQELLELSRIESGRVPLVKKLIETTSIITNTAERMQLQAERAGLNYKYACDIDLPKILVDPTRIEQVLMNIIHNAIKFTSPGGEILISAYKESSSVIFLVRDTGIGIPPKDLERIFERFYKTDRSRSQKGTGLGLSISRHLVEAHEGKIWVESTLGKGSTFYFSIPLN